MKFVFGFLLVDILSLAIKIKLSPPFENDNYSSASL